MISHIQDEILKLKRTYDITVLAHSYQAEEILEVADFTGDSFQLSLMAQNTTAQNILLCGVHFMAETAKILSPKKRVFLANSNATCPMAEQMEPELICKIKEIEPDRKVVAYINTTAKLKAISDVCVTSSSAVKIVKNMNADKILFIPDCNLGDYVKRQIPEKDIKLLHGGCPVHASVTVSNLEQAKELHPDALVLVHPECVPEVVKRADYVGATSGIMDFAVKSTHKEFIIGTEISITQHLQHICLNKNFYNLSKKILCPNMKITTLVDVYKAIQGIGDGSAFEILMTDEEISASRACIDEMIRLG